MTLLRRADLLLELVQVVPGARDELETVLEHQNLARLHVLRPTRGVVDRDLVAADPRHLGIGTRRRRGLAGMPKDAEKEELPATIAAFTAPFSAVYVTHNLTEAVRLGHRIIVLSRRPGTIRTVIEIDVPLAERDIAQPELAGQAQSLWQLIRDEAAQAEQELLGSH